MDAGSVNAEAIAAAAGALVGLAWVATLLRFHRAGRAFPELDAAAHPGTCDARVSVVVAAKDEERSIEACVRSVLAQDHPALELVVVDDRSADATPGILARLAAEHPDRLKVLRVTSLPPGWGGQCHALHLGAAASRGEWLCFTDADCRLDSPRALSIACREARARGVALLSILPRLEAVSAWERLHAPLCSFVLLIHLRITQVNDPASDAAYANGAFMLVRKDAYEALGGHAGVRGRVNDDVALAGLAKRAGLGVFVAGNRGLCRARMYTTVRGAWHGWTRNFYGTLHDARRLAAALGTALGLFVLPTLGLAACAALGWPVAAGAWAFPVVVGHAGLWRLWGASGLRPAWSLLQWPGAVFVAAILARATLRAARRAGTTWHGVHYEHPTAAPPSPPP